MARSTRTFTDLDLNFIANPATGDISIKTNENAIRQSIKNLILTLFYEKPFHPEIGSQVSGLLFEPFSPLLVAMLKRAITDTIENFEPRVTLDEVGIGLDFDNNEINISIFFRIVNTETPLLFTTTLKRTR